MLKLLIVDDEMLICKMIEKFIDWESIDIQIIGIANDGLEAYDQYILHKPDIILTDIKMPLCDGIKFSKRVRVLDENVEFIIMSAFADFEYAQSAIKLGCVEYVLKPLDEDELEKIMIGLISKIKKNYKDKKMIQNTKSQRNQQLLYKHMQKGNSNQITTDLITDININFDDYFLISINLLSENINQYMDISNLKEEQIHLMRDKITQLSEKYGQCYLFDFDNSSWVLIISGVNMKGIVDFALEIVQYFLMTYNITISVCFSDRTSYLSNLPETYTKLTKLNRYNFYIDSTNILGYGYNCSIEEFNKLSLIDTQKDIIKNIKEGNRIQAVLLLKSILKTSKNINPLYLDEIYEICYEIIILIKKCMTDYYVALEDSEEITNISYDTLLKYNNIDKLNAFMSEVVIRVSELFMNGPVIGNKIIERSIKYMEENYDKKLSLNDISEYMAMSKNYFCYIFKKETGKNLWTYLTEIRMDKAKKLIDNTNLKTYEIAYQLGYENPNYFSKIFKKTFNMTPSEYKKRK